MILTDPSQADKKIKSKILNSVTKIINSKQYILGKSVNHLRVNFQNFVAQNMQLVSIVEPMH